MQRNRLVAALVAFFLGGIGMQWFYLGNAKNGVLSFLFCWTFIPSFIALYHVATFLMMSDEKFEEKYGA